MGARPRRRAPPPGRSCRRANSATCSASGTRMSFWMYSGQICSGQIAWSTEKPFLLESSGWLSNQVERTRDAGRDVEDGVGHLRGDRGSSRRSRSPRRGMSVSPRRLGQDLGWAALPTTVRRSNWFCRSSGAPRSCRRRVTSFFSETSSRPRGATWPRAEMRIFKWEGDRGMDGANLTRAGFSPKGR